MGRLAGFRYREIVKRLKRLGFEFDRQAAGSHEIWFNPETRRYTTIPNHPGDMPEGTLRAILRQAGVEPEAFLGSSAHGNNARAQGRQRWRLMQSGCVAHHGRIERMGQGQRSEPIILGESGTP